MESQLTTPKISPFDERRDLVVPGDYEATIRFAAAHILTIAHASIEKTGFFAVAFSGGQTPQAIFRELSLRENQKKTDWNKWLCFWSDERNVPSSDPESNYGMAMRAGLGELPLTRSHIFPMETDGSLDQNATSYEALIRTRTPLGKLDLVMLGLGEDGHTASLFPRTLGLHAKNSWVIPNYIPQKHSWRLTLTFDCIQSAGLASLYVMGKQKADIVAKVLKGTYDPDNLPAQRVGTSSHKSLWILDREASAQL